MYLKRNMCNALRCVSLIRVDATKYSVFQNISAVLCDTWTLTWFYDFMILTLHACLCMYIFYAYVHVLGCPCGVINENDNIKNFKFPHFYSLSIIIHFSVRISDTEARFWAYWRECTSGHISFVVDIPPNIMCVNILLLLCDDLGLCLVVDSSSDLSNTVESQSRSSKLSSVTISFLPSPPLLENGRASCNKSLSGRRPWSPLSVADDVTGNGSTLDVSATTKHARSRTQAATKRHWRWQWHAELDVDAALPRSGHEHSWRADIGGRWLATPSEGIIVAMCPSYRTLRQRQARVWQLSYFERPYLVN